MTGRLAGLQREGRHVRSAIDLDHLARYTGGEKALNAEILRLFDGQVTDMVGRAERACCQRATPSAGARSPTPSKARRAAWALSAWAKRRRRPSRSIPPMAPKAKAAIQKLETEAQTVRGFIQTYLAA